VQNSVSDATASVVSGSKAAARIRGAAIEAFAESGYGGTTTRDIAARLGLSAAAMYPHYKSKEELLYAIAYEGHQTTVEWLQAADPVTEPPADRLRAVVAEFARTQAQYHARARVVEYALAALDPNHYRVILGLRRELTRHVRRIVEAGSADGSFTVPDREGVTLAIISLCVDVCRWFPAGRYTDPAKVAKLYPELAIRLVGADARTGRKR
jgi:AcrR family transcriptional regulator